MGRDRNDRGRYADGIDPDTVIDVFDAREDTSRPVTAGDVVEELGIARRTAHNKLNALVERGVLETRKIGARGRVWWTPNPRRQETPEDAARDAEAVDTAQPSREDGTRDTRPTRAENDPLADVLDDLPGTVDRAAAREAIDAAREYLLDDGPAPKAAIVRSVMPSHALAYDADAALEKLDAPGERYRGSWWREVIKPGLEAFDDVAAPAPGASDWRAGEVSP
jgi:hypothetical protein